MTEGYWLDFVLLLNFLVFAEIYMKDYLIWFKILSYLIVMFYLASLNIDMFLQNFNLLIE